jgi:hypothetical protein
MKLLLLTFTLLISQLSWAMPELKPCSLRLQGEAGAEKSWTSDGMMISKACEEFAHLYLRQNEKNYQLIFFKHGDGEWKKLKLEDVVDEVAHP